MTAAPEDLTVLVVDDDFMVASIHTRFVERAEGFRVVGVAATGEAALAEIERLAPDLVLLDVHLPDISGIDVLRRLRGEGNDVGVMMVTAAREADTVRAAAAAGAAHYLVKPFEFDDLLARLQAFRQSHLALVGSDHARPGGHRRGLRPAGARTRGAAQGTERRDRGRRAGGPRQRTRDLRRRVRGRGRRLPGQRPPLPRALRGAGSRDGAAELRRCGPPGASLPVGPLSRVPSVDGERVLGRLTGRTERAARLAVHRGLQRAVGRLHPHRRRDLDRLGLPERQVAVEDDLALAVADDDVRASARRRSAPPGRAARPSGRCGRRRPSR